jgi:hypothetical protein
MSKATCPIDGEPSIREIIAELASGAYIVMHDNGRYELRQPGKYIGNHTMQHHLIRDGWLESFANCGGYRLSSAGKRAYMRSTDELGDSELAAPATVQAAQPVTMPEAAAGHLRRLMGAINAYEKATGLGGWYAERVQECSNALLSALGSKVRFGLGHENPAAQPAAPEPAQPVAITGAIEPTEAMVDAACDDIGLCPEDKADPDIRQECRVAWRAMLGQYLRSVAAQPAAPAQAAPAQEVAHTDARAAYLAAHGWEPKDAREFASFSLGFDYGRAAQPVAADTGERAAIKAHALTTTPVAAHESAGVIHNAADTDTDAGTGAADALPIPEKIAAIIEHLHTQDNRITDNPLFAVQQRRRIYGVDGDYAQGSVWMDEDGIERTEQTAIEHGARKLGYVDEWEFVTGCFTEQGCKDYIAANGHNLKDPRIYAYGSYRNAEFIALRKWLMSLRARQITQAASKADAAGGA